MERPDNIPEDVWTSAVFAADAVLIAAGSGLRYYDLNGTREKIVTAAATALLAERNRCAEIAEAMLQYADTTSRADQEIAKAIRGEHQ